MVAACVAEVARLACIGVPEATPAMSASASSLRTIPPRDLSSPSELSIACSGEGFTLTRTGPLSPA
jgi:hypothetical protein